MPRHDVAAPQAGAFAMALRTIRRRRGLRVAEIAQRMGLARRTYEYFEARSRLEWAKLQRFAAATDSDACAILISVAMDDPNFAARCVDSRLVSQLVDHLQTLNTRLGDDLSALDPADVAPALATLVDTLAAKAGMAASKP